MAEQRFASAGAAAAVLIVGLASVLEGATLPVYGGPCVVAIVLLAMVAVALRGVDRPGPMVWCGLALLGVTLLWQVIPLPAWAHRLVAPGQSALVDMAAPSWTGDLDAWLDALTRFDVLAAVGVGPAWDYDPLAGSVADAARAGTLSPAAWPWAVAQLVGGGIAVVLGVAIGRSERGARTFAVLLLLLCVAEALFGIANRNAATTGLGVKTAYLGSATGTLINRGHYAALLALGLGAAWGLAAALFPLLPEEVRRHRARKRRSSHPPSVMEASGDKVPRLVVLLFGAAVLGIGLVASQSRGPVLSFVLVAAGVGAYAWRRRDESFHLGIGVGLLAVSGVLAAIGFGVRGAFGRFASMLDAGDVSFTSRLQVWEEGLRAFRDAPVFGAGAGAWRLAWGARETGLHLYDFSHAHNELVERLVELGAVGTLGLGLLAFCWLRGVGRGIDAADATPRTAIGIGLLVGVGAVVAQSAVDFPLHTPAVLLATTLAAGVSYGAVTERAGAAARAWVPQAVGAGVIVLAVWAAVADRDHPGSRAQRLGEIPRVYYDAWAVSEPGSEVGFAARAAHVASVAPLDPWGQLALAVAELKLVQAARAGEAAPSGPEDHAFAAERAIARALKLRPRAPRVQVAAARVLVGLAATGYPDARRERAVSLLMEAVRGDPWRAREAFELTAHLPSAMLDRVGTALPDAPAARARVRYEYGHALDLRGDKAGARAAFAAALAEDPSHGPSLFALGVIARGEGDEALMRDLLRRFLAAKERPGGMEGWALVYLDELSSAEVRFRRAVGDNPENLWAWEGLAEIALRMGDAEAERQVWRRVLQVRPAYKRALLRLEALGE